jgi:two-component system, chemotaxis family, protein-glutamate methylesterase/glutaminase
MPTPPVACERVVVIGASAGGLEVVREIVRGLPRDFPAAVALVVHISPTAPGLLPIILTRAGVLPCVYATEGEPLECAHLYIAPPNRHLLLRAGRLMLDDGPRENGFRPAIDPLFRSAANAFDGHVIGVILSGAMDDGTAGLAAIQERGGATVVQNPDTAIAPSMPQSALRNVRIDCVADPAKLANVLVRLVQQSLDPPPATAEAATAVDPATMTRGEFGSTNSPTARPDNGSPPRCPDCGGPMREVTDAHVMRYRCHEGHMYTAGSLLAKQVEQNSTILRQATSALHEQAALGRRVADRAEARGDRNFADFVRRTVVRVEERARRLNELLRESESDPEIDIT